MSSGRSADCRKFAPNIFNKSKCTNCFRQKEEHSAEALESNRASRKVSKCGYLFVAPGWDFSNPLYRTKRWQRRWFVLYDDGELTYSLDEHPDTVPQASVDMTAVIEVSEADNVTGHQHSLAITSPERVTFVKGTCREESKWWAEVLSVFPRSKGRHKRNATFPGSAQRNSLLESSTATRNGCSTPSRQRFNSCHTTGLHSLPRPQPPQPEIQTLTAPQPIETKVYNDQPVSSASPPTRDKINGDEKARSRRDQRRDTWTDGATVVDESVVNHRSPLSKQYDEQLRDIAASLTRPRSRRALPPHLERPTRDASDDNMDSREPIHDLIIRGSPDGGAPPPEEPSEATDNGSNGSSGENSRVELPAERLLHARAGWLQHRSKTGWSRHWFVLRGAALLYFRDPQAEQRGLMDGVIDLSGVARVVNLPVTSANGYAFETETWDGKHYVLSAVTAGIRANWVAAIGKTAGLPDSPCSPPPLLREDSLDASETSTAPITPLTPRSAPFSSDDEYRTASEGGRRDSVDWTDGTTQLPPSPVPTRTPISKVKDKVRARACHQPSPAPIISSSEVLDEIDAAKAENVIDTNDYEPRSRTYKRSYVSTIDKQSIEIDDLRERLKMALSDVSAAEKELARLRRAKLESTQREKKMEELVVALQKAEEELELRTCEVEGLEVVKRLYNQDKAVWESKVAETQKFLRESTERCEMLTKQLSSAQETIQTLQNQLSDLNDKLHQIVNENDSLYAKINEFERTTSPRKEKRKSIGSLSELADIEVDLDLESIEKDKLIEEYAELRTRFMRAIHEIKVMKRELRESHDMYDELEITNIKLHNEMKLREECSRNEINVMAAKIQDLTQKLTASDKQVRTLKHKIQKSESREKRRSLSLKGRESFTIGKEVEEKLVELENKITQLESTGNPQAPIITAYSSKNTLAPLEEVPKADKREAIIDDKKMKRLAARLRRKSLDSATSSEPMKMLVRLSSLETKITSALDGRKDIANSCESLSQTTRSSDSPSFIESPENGSIGSHSQRHLLERLQSLENIVILSRNKVNECLCQMSALKNSKSRRSPSPGMEKKSSVISIEKCLTEVSRTLQECFDKCVVECEPKIESDVDDGIVQAVFQIEEQLRQKLLEISKKKADLLEAGELTQRKNLELLAEKLAYEAVLVGQIQETLEASNGSKFFAGLIKSEINETSQLIKVLQKKINGGAINSSFDRRSPLDYLAKILSRKIDIINNASESKNSKQSENIVQSSDVEALKKAQAEITAAVEKFKSDKLSELSFALANETLSYVSANDCDFEQQRANLEATRVREAWAAARDALGAELVQADVARALSRAAHQCEESLTATRKARLTLSAQQTADLELWWQAAHHHLRAEMDVAVRDIAVQYRECLNSIDRNIISSNNNIVDSRALLQQLADVLAHKALIDARIAVIDGTYQANPQGPGSKSELSSLFNTNQPVFGDNVMTSLESDPNQEAEFIFLFQQFSNECRALFSSDCSSNSEDLMKISKNLEQVEIQVREVHKQLNRSDDSAIEEYASSTDDCSQLQKIVTRCESLKQRVEALSTLVPCKHCKQLQDALDKLKSERSRGETAMQQQAGALAAARQARQQLQVQHERERQQLRERARRLERRLATLDSEYSQQLDNLKTAYHNTIGTDVPGENLRARYQAEIEQLRALCEKGLLAMESSHRRIVHEMEEKHRAEREQLRLEKEAALAEETRATLAALDAMRKAHESEVRREVEKFKAEFLCRGGAAQISTRHQQEMEEIKQEILSLSEKYSVKCVESAALEERLVNATQQLAHAQQHIMQLDARNKQLRAHLMSETNDMKSVEQSSLAHLIEETASHGRSAQGPLWEHLKHLASVWQHANPQEAGKVSANELRASNDSSTQDKNTIRQDGKHKKLAAVPRPELKSTSRCSASGRASLSPLVGMVAERKKRFELDA